MAIEIKKLQDLEYNELITIGVIERDEFLRNMFTEEVKISFNVLRTLSKEGKLNEGTQEVLKDTFDKIICTQKGYINMYLRLANGQTMEQVTEQITEPPKATPQNVLHKMCDTPKLSTPKLSTNKLPRRHGKIKIMEDIAKQGGKATPLQNAMLKVNELKNIWVNLSARGVKDMLGGTHLLSDADCRDIVAVVQIAERKLEEILKRK